MAPLLALFLWLILLLALLRFDPAKHSGTSLASWVPLIWIFIVGTRLPSQWLGSQTGVAAQALEEGNLLDRTILSILILLAICILVSRAFNWGAFFLRNFTLILFLAFALVSFLWSDFPLVALKRWFRDLGSYFMVLVVLSEPCPLEAVRTLLRRFCYLSIPLSIVLVKYYSDIGRQYDQWAGTAMFVGATTSKNMLGVVCLISGILFFWDTVTRWSDHQERRTKRILLLNAAFMVMTLWLLTLSNSATSSVCLVIGCLVIVAVHSRWGRGHTIFIKVAIPATFCLYLILAFGFDLNGAMASQVGRNPTLTDRTLIWKTVLHEHTNPLVGTGYESFWLGPRLQRIWEEVGHINETHNGYLDIYVNLGAIGLVLLVAFLLASYRTICKKLTSSFALASLSLSIWTVILFYNVTEAAFKGGLLWLLLLLGTIAISERAEDQVRSKAIGNLAGVKKQFTEPPLATASLRRRPFDRSSTHR
jgi:exopolysaccharide production protein ExoQ